MCKPIKLYEKKSYWRRGKKNLILLCFCPCIKWLLRRDTPLGRARHCFFPATSGLYATMQFSLKFVSVALALVTAASDAPVDLGARPMFMPGPIVPDESYTGYNPFKAAVTTTGSDN